MATDSRLLGSFCPHGMAFLLQACRSYCRCDFMDKTQLACLNVSVVFCCIIYNIQYIIWMYDYVVFFAWNQKLQRFKDAVRTPSLWTLEVIAFDRDEWRGHGTEVASDRPWVWSRLRTCQKSQQCSLIRHERQVNDLLEKTWQVHWLSLLVE